jgi:hypothetical protein
MRNRVFAVAILCAMALGINHSCGATGNSEQALTCDCEPARLVWMPLDVRNDWHGVDAAYACDPRGFVHLRGLIWREEINPNHIAFILPDDCKPVHFAALAAVTHLEKNPESWYVWIDNGSANVGPSFVSLYGLSAPLD